MRLLCLPLIGATSNVPSESNFASFRALWRCARRRYRHLWVTVAVPHSQVPPVREALTAEERAYVEVIGEPMVPPTFYVQEAVWSPRLVNRYGRHCGTTYVDLVLTSRTSCGYALTMALRDWRGAAGRPTVGLYEPGLDDHPTIGALADPIRIGKALSVATCPTQYLTPREMELAVSWARRWLSADLVDEVYRYGRVIQPTVPTVAPNPTAEPAEHTLFFGGRLNSNKRIEFIADLYADVFALGHQVRVTVTSPSTIKPQFGKLLLSKGRGKDGVPLVLMIGHCGRDQFRRHAALATIGVTASVYEGFPYGFLEMAVSGQLTLFPEKAWARSSLPADYPWFYRDRADAYAIIARAVRGQWREMVCRQLDSLRRWHHTAQVPYDDQRWAFWTEQRWNGRPGRSAGDENEFVQILRRHAATHETFTFREALKAIEDGSRNVTPRCWTTPPPRFYPRPWVHYALTTSCGVVDVCDGPSPRYVQAAAAEGVA